MMPLQDIAKNENENRLVSSNSDCYFSPIYQQYFCDCTSCYQILVIHGGLLQRT